MTGLLTLCVIVLLIWAEIETFGLIGSAVGALLTIIGVFITAAVGLRLFRHLGRATLRRMAEVSAAGKPPVVEVADGVAILIAAGLLLIPGYVTDMLGLVFFIPGLRVFLVVVILGKVLHRVSSRHFTASAGGGFRDVHSEASASQGRSSEKNASDMTIEGEFERKD